MRWNNLKLIIVCFLFADELHSQNQLIQIDSVYNDSVLSVITEYSVLDSATNLWTLSRVIRYYPNGQILEEFTSVRTSKFCETLSISLINGPYISYYESGSIKEICNYTFGRITGPYFKFYENGTSQIVGSYKQITDLCEYEIERDSVISHEFMEETITLINRLSSIREGRWATYDSNGTLISEIYY